MYMVTMSFHFCKTGVERLSRHSKNQHIQFKYWPDKEQDEK